MSLSGQWLVESAQQSGDGGVEFADQKDPAACAAGSSLSVVSYLMESANARQAPALKASVPPSRSVVSRTRITPLSLAVSTHAPPFGLLKLDFRQSMPTSTHAPPCAPEKLDFRQSMPRLASRSSRASH